MLRPRRVLLFAAAVVFAITVRQELPQVTGTTPDGASIRHRLDSQGTRETTHENGPEPQLSIQTNPLDPLQSDRHWRLGDAGQFDCVEKGRRGDPVVSTQHAAEILAAWKRRPQSNASRLYCIAQCGPNKCCPNAFVTAKAFETIKYAVLPAKTLSQNEVTLTTQGSADRIATFRKVLAAWEGPIVAIFVIYNNSNAESDAAKAAAHRAEVLQLSKEMRPNVELLLYSVSFPLGTDYYGSMFPSKAKLALFPVNTLRNVAIDRSRTNWVFPLDIDFVPSRTLYTSLTRFHLPHLVHVNRVVLVVPHFELPKCTKRVPMIPETFSQIQAMLLKLLVFPFHVRADRVIQQLAEPGFARKLYPAGNAYLDSLNPRDCFRPTGRSWPWGILATNYSRWFNDSVTGLHGTFRLQLPPAEALDPKAPGRLRLGDHSSAWEPFVVVRRIERHGEEELPRYSEAFVGRYRNKVEFITQLRAKRYKFYTVLQEFVTHITHPVSNATLDDMLQLKKNMIDLHTRWTGELIASAANVAEPQQSAFEDGYVCKVLEPN